MDEQEWLACSDPGRLVNSPVSQKIDRKLRLFACACCRQVWDALAGGQEVVLVAERFADGLALLEELEEAGLPPSHPIPADTFGHLANGLNYLTDPDAINAAYGTADSLATWAELREQQRTRGQHQAGHGPEEVRAAGERAGQAVRRGQCVLLRDILGNPFHPVEVDPAWLTPAAQALAHAAYEERELPQGTLDPARLAVLADALEEVGCRDQQVLQHLRGPGPHVRGCFVVDLLLGKQ
jgi:hypothetical protein